jgi:hypothetical protein
MPSCPLQYSRLLEPLRPTSKPSAKRLQELLACHKRFCEQQLANTKTARVLDAAFDPAFSQQYMEQLMFDYSPTEDVPWFDGGLAKLFDYFEKNPEIWQDAGLFMKVSGSDATLQLSCKALLATAHLKDFGEGVLLHLRWYQPETGLVLGCSER